MDNNSIYYYPYANLGEDQLSMLKAVALYFDKLYILDPSKASFNSIGAGQHERDIALLEREGFLQRIAPEEVMHEFEEAIAGAITADLNDAEFLRLCNEKSKAQWTLALAKIPKAIRDDPKFQPLDRSMQEVLRNVGESYSEQYAESVNEIYDEYRETNNGVVEYRYADYPFSVGEAIMLNHALVGSLLHTNAVPVTDDQVHNNILNYKLQKAQQIPEIREVLESRRDQQQFAGAQAAIQALTDLDLGIMPNEVSVEQILEYRHQHGDSLTTAREEMAWRIRKLMSEPWSKSFEDEVYHKLIPELNQALEPARNTWRNWLTASSIAIGGTTIALGLIGSPITPVALSVAGLTIADKVGISGLQWFQDWKSGKSQNGLHYLIKFKQ